MDGDYDPLVKCMHITAGDGFVTMADGEETYMFGYADVTGVEQTQAIDAGILSHNMSAPTIELEEGQAFYLTLTNTGMVQRPDLFDAHTVHFHGYANASIIFDGVPDTSISINGGTSLSYFYQIRRPGTYMYHCHVEATEHMQMGMIGNLYVKPAQDGAIYDDPTDSEVKDYNEFAYNDGDGSTGYDVDFPIQLTSLDKSFHDESRDTQPLSFALMEDDYFMINGRNYPETKDPATRTFRTSPSSGAGPNNPAVLADPTGVPDGLHTSQPVSAHIEVNSGERILLRLSNVGITVNFTLRSLGLTMKVVGADATQLRGPTGLDVYYETDSLTFGGGEARDVLIDTTGVPSGTYFLYTTNLNFLSNGPEDFGGMMTEITIL
jgi:FtsP/CotA-like multicopper oxidase with cupredoxin domain